VGGSAALTQVLALDVSSSCKPFWL